MLEIAAFGKISVGKSALLNGVFSTTVFAVDPRGGSTTEPQRRPVRIADHELIIIDTPGIGEVGGASRSEQAREIAGQVDLVLVLFDQDPTQLEYAEVEKLAEASKPMLVLLNKADALSQEQRHQLYGRIVQRLAEHADPANVLICAADPIRYRASETADGSVREWVERAQPDVEQVRQRLLIVLETEQQILQDVDQVAKSAQTEEQRVRRARERAGKIIDDFALGMAIGVAANPIPLVDVLGGGAALVVLVRQLARCYGVDTTQKEIKTLATHLFKEGRPLLWPAIIPLIGGALLKLIPFVGWALGAIGQAAAAYYVTYVLGHACSDYFAADKKWAGCLREIIEQVMARTDRKSVSRRAAERIRERLGK